MLLSLQCKLRQKTFLVSVKLIEYSDSDVIVVSSNPSIGFLPRIRISLFLLSTCSEKLLSTPNTITLIRNPQLINEKDERVSNPVSYPEQQHLSDRNI